MQYWPSIEHQCTTNLGPSPLKKTWSRTLKNKHTLPDNWINTPEVLVGMYYCEQRGREGIQPVHLPVEPPWSTCQLVNWVPHYQPQLVLAYWFPQWSFFFSGAAHFASTHHTDSGLGQPHCWQVVTDSNSKRKRKRNWKAYILEIWKYAHCLVYQAKMMTMCTWYLETVL